MVPSWNHCEQLLTRINNRRPWTSWNDQSPTTPEDLPTRPGGVADAPARTASNRYYNRRIVIDGRRSPRYDIPAALAHLSAADPKLAALIRRAGPFTLKLKHQHSPFEALLESIIYQQIHGKAAAAILRRLIEAFGDLHPQPEQLIAAPDHILRGAGLSGSKALALRDLAAKTLDGTVPSLLHIRRMSDQEIIERLTAVRGIGPWTVEMLLIFRLGRPDVLPLTDYGVRKGFLLTFGRVAKSKPITAAMLPKPDVMLRRARKWQPWRSVASWYLWRACDLAGKPSPQPD